MRSFLLLLLLLGCGLLRAADESVPSQRVGQPLLLREIYLPGAEAKPTPRRDDKPPLVVRILEVRPAKDGFRYDLEVQGLEPGRHNVADYLSSDRALPEIPIEIVTPLPPGLPSPHPIAQGELPRLGGYRTRMIVLGALWVAGFVGILLWKKKAAATDAAEQTGGEPLAERLKPLVTGAADGTLDTAGRARLERLLIGYWRERLPEIAALSPAEAMARLRHHPEAAPLLQALERWLHAPGWGETPADLETLLAPYRGATA